MQDVELSWCFCLYGPFGLMSVLSLLKERNGQKEDPDYFLL